MAESEYWYLENINLQFVFCPKKVDRGDLQVMDHLTYAAQEYVYLPQEPAQKIYLISRGRIKLGTHGENGKEVTKAILTEGEVFGEMALIGQAERRDFAYALEDTDLCVLQKDDLHKLFRERGELHAFFLRLIGNRSLRLEQRLENLMFKSSRTRITDFLHELIETRGRKVGYEWEVRNMLTHKEIADLTGTSRQTVNSVLNELRRDEVLVFDRRRMLVRDVERLV